MSYGCLGLHPDETLTAVLARDDRVDLEGSLETTAHLTPANLLRVA